MARRAPGKSWLIKSICDSTPDHIIYDPLNEHDGYRRYIPDDRDSKSELSDMITGIVVPQRPAVFIIDEGNKYIRPKPAPLPAPGVADMLDFSRHYGVAFWRGDEKTGPGPLGCARVGPLCFCVSNCG